MALATRELELVLIARDRASSVLARVGGALVILGGGLARLGMQGIREFREMTGEAMDFNKAVALAFTQAEGVAGASLDSIGEMVLNTFREVPRPLEEMLGTTYDIFSTLPVENMAQVQELLDAVARSAVAGNAPMEDIGRSMISWMNALDMTPNLENANRLLDIQFELVRKGAGTYAEFSGEVGKSIPAYVAANQSVESFGGTLAFLTRNGLTAAMAATSAARSVELMYSPKAIKGIEALGISTTDTNGHFRQMVDIMEDLLPHFDGLSDAERKIKFKEIFGTGRIQARRFFDVAFQNFEEWKALVGEMEGAAGVTAEAYGIMFAEPAVQLEHMLNLWESFRIEVGERFVPLFTEKVLPIVLELNERWQDLDDTQKDNLVKWGSYATLGTTVGGALVSVVGMLSLLSGLLKVGGTSMGAVMLKTLGFIGVLAALIYAGYYVIKNWDEVKAKAQEVWDKVDSWLTSMLPLWDEVKAKAKEVWSGVADAFTNWWDDDVYPFLRSLYDKLVNEVWPSVYDAVRAFGDTLQKIWNRIWNSKIPEIIRKAYAKIWKIAKRGFKKALDIIRDVFEIFAAIFTGDWERFWNGLTDLVKDVGQSLWLAMKGIWEAVKLNWNVALEALGMIASTAWNMIKTAATNIWNNHIYPFLAGVWQKIVDVWHTIFDPVFEWFSNAWNWLWKEIIEPIWSTMRDVAEVVFAAVAGAIYVAWEGIKVAAKFAWDWIEEWLLPLWDGLSAAAGLAWDAVMIAISAVWESIDEAAHTLWEGLKIFFETIWGTIRDVATGVWDGIKAVILEPIQLVVSLIKGDWRDAKKHLKQIWENLKSMASRLFNAIKRVILAPIRLVKTTVIGLFRTVKSIVLTVARKIKEQMGKIWDRIKRVILTPWNSAVGIVKASWRGLKRFFSWLNPFDDAALDIEGMRQKSENLRKSWKAIKRVIDDWKAERFREVGQVIAEYIPTATAQIEALRDATRRVGRQFGLLGQKAADAMENLGSAVAQQIGPVMEQLAALREIAMELLGLAGANPSTWGEGSYPGTGGNFGTRDVNTYSGGGGGGGGGGDTSINFYGDINSNADPYELAAELGWMARYT